MPFALAFGAVLVAQTAAAADYWHGDRAKPKATARLRVASVFVAVGLIALVSVAWDGLGFEPKACASLTGLSDLRSSEEYVLGSCLVAAVLSLVVAAAAGRSRRTVAWLLAVAFAATVVAGLYFASHAYAASCLGD